MTNPINRKPNGIQLTYQEFSVPSALSKPYNLTAIYDEFAIGPSRYLTAIGFDATVYGATALVYTRPIATNGFIASSFGQTVVENKNKLIDSVTLGVQTEFGGTLAYNLTQHVKLVGDEQSLYGKPYLAGGVVWLLAGGADTSFYGETLVINTTANRDLIPQGFDSSAIPEPNVKPWILHAVGIDSQRMGIPSTRTAALVPKGFYEYNYGTPTIWYRTRSLQPTGISSYETGYALVFDPTQFIQPPSLITSAIFGDTATKNLSHFIRPSAINDGDVSVWAIFENYNRYYSLNGFASQAIGSAAITNKTPSIFVEGITPYGTGTPAMGYAIRAIAPSGFDRLLLGTPLLTKTPELLPAGIDSLAISKPTVWYKSRGIKLDGIDSAVFSEPTIWFRYRNLYPNHWLSQALSEPTATHGARRTITSGFNQDGYGQPWVSQGTRLLEPLSIHEVRASKHMVGYTREIKPLGYIATLFGERIVPNSRTVGPLGFTGLWGLAEAGLYTRYLSPIGYISVGQQSADRWGNSKAYNKAQYIKQEFDGDNGLVPPAWSEWTLIENRNKQLNASGLNSLRLGYAQIDNNAAPLLPLGIAPPTSKPSEKTMIAYSSRHLNADGIDFLLMGTWGVVFNDARVLAPYSFTDSGYGVPSAANNRRYYRDYGHIDSLETGTPAIGYAIRAIDIEPRYSIQPPQINLPTIDLWTKYATFNGYETAAYGTPSLSIHFRNIAPKWKHRDNAGEPAVKNLTPMLGVYGYHSEDFGVSSIRTQWRNIQAFGDTATLFGMALIADSKKAIEVRGWRDTMLSQKHTVVRTGAPPYSEQRISLDGWYDYDTADAEYVEGNGIYFNENIMGERIPRPSINQNVLYAKGFDSPEIGIAVVWSNNLVIESGIARHSFGDSLSVRNSTSEIILTGENPILATITVGRPRLSPHTIYAMTEASDQAKANHPITNGTGLHTIDGYNGQTLEMKIGRPRLENTIRNVKAQGVESMVFGARNKLTLSRNIIAPKSFRVRRFGVPSIPFTDQSLNTFSDNKDMARYGEPALHIPDTGNKELLVTGFSSQVISKCDVQLKTRFVDAVGFDNLVMGAQRDNDTPYMWQGLRIGAHVPTAITGGDMSVFGVSWVSLKIRQVGAEGFCVFASEYDIGSFEERMTIKLKKSAINNMQIVSAIGFNAEINGAPLIKNNQHFIRPDGNSDQYRKGGYHA